MRICDVPSGERQQTVEMWVAEETTRLEQRCREVTEQVESWVTRTEQRCQAVRNQVCTALPWPFSLLCNWVVSVVCSVLTTVARLLSWVVRQVCELVTTIVKSLKKVIAVIVTPIIGFGCALFGTRTDRLLDDDPGDLSGVNFDRRNARSSAGPFLWGAATAATQVEGSIADNDWERFTSSPAIRRRTEWRGEQGGTHLRIEAPGRAIDHWNLDVLAEDLDRARALGLNAYRFSIEWSRIQPEAPPWAKELIQTRLAIQDRLAAATEERRMAREGNGDSALHERRAAELEREGAALEGRAAGLEDTPYDAGEFDIDAAMHYVEMVRRMRDRDLEPILTLHHMSLPAWVLTPPIANDITSLFTVEDEQFWGSLRGWESAATVKAYGKLVRFLVPLFRDSVRWWVTINEPVGSMTAAPYLAGVWPPGFLGDGDRGRRVYRNLIQAHVTAYDTVKELAGDGAQVGFSHWIAFARRAPQTVLARWFVGDNEAAKNQWNYAWIYYFLDAVVHGHDNPDIWRKAEPTIRDEWRGHLDFVAPQYYRAADVYHDVALAMRAPWAGGQFVADLRGRTDYLSQYLTNDLGWTIYPGGLYHMLVDLHGRYDKPIFLTENGTCEDQDRNRAAFTLAHLQQVLRAIRDGVDVVGYLHWSLVDNWEWAFDYMPEARFGLFGIDRDAEPAQFGLLSLPRHVTEGALGYQHLIANSHWIAASRTQEDPFQATVARFGTIAGDGLRVVPPERQLGGIWTGRFKSGEASNLVLYLSRLSGGGWVGMIYVAAIWRWYRLDEIAWDQREGELRFTHQLGAGGHPMATWLAAVTPDPDAGHARLSGTVDWGGSQRDWEAARDAREGVWRSTGAGPSHLGLFRLEGERAPWRSKFIYGRPIWTASGGTVSVDGTDVATPLDGLGTFRARIAGTRMLGTITRGLTHGGTRRTDWAGERLPEDDLP